MTFQFIAEVVFWLSAVALFYTYLGYPLVLFVVSTLRGRGVERSEWSPDVTVIITAYNEEQALAAKLENTLSIDYPREKLEVIVASDCSTDATDSIAKNYSSQGVKLIRLPERAGKTAAQNRAVEEAGGEIIVFSDATTFYQPDVLKVILPSFADPTVGCVAGRLIYVDPTDSTIGHGAQSYWSYETFLKRHESRASSLIGASGCLYAVRRSAYRPMYPEACSDFLIATIIVEQGLRAVFEPLAVSIEETNRDGSKEFEMRVRVIAQTLNDLWQHRGAMNPFRTGFYSVQLFSHKVMRYLVPFFLVMILIVSGVNAQGSTFYAAMFLAQILFYLAAFCGLLLEKYGIRNRLFALPHYFLLANLASLTAVFKFLSGQRYAKWEPVRQRTGLLETEPLGARGKQT